VCVCVCVCVVDSFEQTLADCLACLEGVVISAINL
jgi:hypothetical protein